MAKNKGSAQDDELARIKRTAIVALFSDDDLFEQLVLKGGNAMDMVLKVSSRASVDLDFSMADDLNLDVVHPKIERVLVDTYRDAGYQAFDIRMTQRPKTEMPAHLVDFWGGYLVEFKLIALTRYAEGGSLEQLRREAINLGRGPKFTIDISRREYVDGKQMAEVDGITIYVYSPMMIVCEKLRAICQQLPAYGEVIQRNGLGKPRARDFVDIEVLVRTFGLDLASDEAKHIVTEMFALKKVPLDYLAQVPGTKDFHAVDFASVRDTVHQGVELRDFDYYHQFVVDQCVGLQPLWNV